MEIHEFERRDFSILKYVWNSRITRAATQGTISKMIKSSSLLKQLKIQILQLEVKSVVGED